MNFIISRPYRRGFTLIELLVVIGLIAVLSAGIGVALTSGGKGTALQSSQGIINSLLSGARGQAAINQADAAIFVNVSPTSDGFLSSFYIATYDGTNWRVTGDPVRLDKEIYLVPPSGEFNVNTEVSYSGTWANLYSTAYEINGDDIELYLSDGSTEIKDDTGTTLKFRIVQVYNSRGVVNNSSPDRAALPAGHVMKIVFSTAQRSAEPILNFNKPQEIRGVLITDYGIPIFVNEAVAFNP